MAFNIKFVIKSLMKLVSNGKPASQEPFIVVPPEPEPLDEAAIIAEIKPVEMEHADPKHVETPEFSMTLMQLQNITRCKPVTRAEMFLEHINDTLRIYRINNSLRAAHFMAQIAHESGDLKYTEELASGKAYEGRKDLGNTSPGDGEKFKGRGLIQITGKFNYTKIGKSLSIDLLSGDNPKQLAQPELAAKSAGWYWDYKKDKFGKNLNDFADQDDFIKITYFVNGGFNGLADRLVHLKRAYIMLGVPDYQQRINRIFNEIESNIDSTSRNTNKLRALAREIPNKKKLDEVRRLVDKG